MAILDWDWETNKYTLDPDDKVEGTSSLCLNGENCVLARHSPVQNLESGILETYLKMGDPTTAHDFWVHIPFYNQAPLGTANMDNCYRFRMYIFEWSLGELVLQEIVAGTVERTFKFSPTQAWMDWQKKRFVWYIKDGILYAYVDHWTGTEWVKSSDIVAVTNPRWLESTVKRVGLALRGAIDPADYTRFDATSIYQITP